MARTTAQAAAIARVRTSHSDMGVRSSSRESDGEVVRGVPRPGPDQREERGRRIAVARTAGAVMRSIVVTGDAVLLGWGLLVRL
ncbi:hypothetical protein GCM10010282_52350 [Streptomyces roseolus]|nr:hypothetical protein GCM10010282_52350 [Streptomyces roseolus]